MESTGDGYTPWKRALYERQSYPDNYVDSSQFLSNLKDRMKISQTHILNYWQVFTDTNLRGRIFESTLIGHQLTVVAIFVAIYKHIMNNFISYIGLLAFDIIIIVLGYLMNQLLRGRKPIDFRKEILSFAVMGIYFRVAAPVLQTLTSSFSDDTIYALGIFFSMAHVLLFDYNYVHNNDDEVKVGALSLSAAMLTAILLVSRIKKIEIVFGFVLLAVISFSLLPTISKLVFKRSKALYLSALFLEWSLASILLFHIKELLSVFFAYQVILVLVSIVGPIGILRMQINKKNLSGPWDIARL